MEIRAADEKSRDKMVETTKLMLDFFSLNNIGVNNAVNACIGTMFTIMKNMDVNQEDFEKTMDVLKDQYAKDMRI